MSKIPEKQLKLYDELIESIEEIERKGKTMPYTSCNGHMFSHLSKEGKMGLRLSPDERSAFIKKYETELFVQHGRIMKEFVDIPDELLAQTDILRTYLLKSLEYTKSLKPK